MKKIGIIIFIVAAAVGISIANLFSFGGTSARFFNISVNHKVSGSGVVASEKRDLSDFKGVDVGGTFQVEIVAQKNFGVEVEADDNLLQYIKTEVKGETLEIKAERSFSTAKPIRVRISAPDIDDLEVSGAANVSLADLKNDSLNVDAGGASKIRVEGETASLTVDLGGASRLDAENLKSENADIDAGGASSASVFVSGDLKADLSGASRVTYEGNPKNFTNKTSGASSISGK